MAYTNAWDVTRPLGSVLANQIDTEIQAVRRDIQERLTTLFGLGLFTPDPLQGIALNLKGATGSKIIPGSVSLSLRNNADSADNVLVTDSGIVLLRGALTGTASTTAGELLLASTKAIRSMNNASSDSFLLIRGNGDRVQIGDGGIPITISGTIVTSAANSDLVFPNGRGIRSVNGANTDTLSLVFLDATNQLTLNLNAASLALINTATHATVGANGGASALTANPVGYINVKIGGTSYGIPYYNP